MTRQPPYTRGQSRLALRVALGLSLAFATVAQAQQLTPRAYWPAPVGTNVLVLTYQHSQGDIVVDQSLPVIGVESSIDYGSLSYQRSFDFQGRSASFSISQGFADGSTSGIFEGRELEVRNVGAQDAVARLAVNLRGAPAMDGPQFRDLMASPKTLLGASVTVAAPTGDYDRDRVLNLSTNRWSIKPEMGIVYPLAPRLLLEFDLGVWFFQDNDQFVGRTREQDPIYNAALHLVRRFRPGFWGSLDVNYYVGGRTTIDGERRADLQRNSRLGGTLVFPVSKGNAVRASLSTGTVTETGGDFELFSLAWIKAF